MFLGLNIGNELVHFLTTGKSKSTNMARGVYVFESDKEKNKFGWSFRSSCCCWEFERWCDCWGCNVFPFIGWNSYSFSMASVYEIAVPSGLIPCSLANWFQYSNPTWFPHCPTWIVIVSLKYGWLVICGSIYHFFLLDYMHTLA